MVCKSKRKDASALRLTSSAPVDNPCLQNMGKGDPLRTRMAFSIDVQKMFEIKMGVFLCRCQTFVSEKFLDNP